MQTHSKTAFGAVALSLAIAAFTAHGALAASPEPAEGTFSVEEEVLVSLQPAGEVWLLEVAATFELEGTFEGTLVGEFFIIHFGPIEQPAPEIFIAEGIYAGDVDGASGEFDFSFVGDIDAEGNAEGDLVIGSGSGELQDLSGMITLTGVTGIGGDYAGSIHFAP